ncbi:MAG: hypothetical protein QOD93_522, partial [Acetobacteraceae bacterium]|nr:hypothetical protein [Acetobacteraceae bacterium]
MRDFIRQHGDKSPKVGGGRKRPGQKTLDWQKRLAEFGYQNFCAEVLVAALGSAEPTDPALDLG